MRPAPSGNGDDEARAQRPSRNSREALFIWKHFKCLEPNYCLHGYAQIFIRP
jgi:hypothetical protein